MKFIFCLRILKDNKKGRDVGMENIKILQSFEVGVLEGAFTYFGGQLFRDANVNWNEAAIAATGGFAVGLVSGIPGVGSLAVAYTGMFISSMSYVANNTVDRTWHSSSINNIVLSTMTGGIFAGLGHSFSRAIGFVDGLLEGALWDTAEWATSTAFEAILVCP
ncbi:MAG: hypothetical protein LBD23_03225 [Oscillospiraceae bacterium]|jgi:hypothetical protein|nr:hypothetical protein [Oscillospiraceae bacterium]